MVSLYNNSNESFCIYLEMMGAIFLPKHILNTLDLFCLNLLLSFFVRVYSLIEVFSTISSRATIRIEG